MYQALECDAGLDWSTDHCAGLLDGECLEAELTEKWVFCRWPPQIGIRLLTNHLLYVLFGKKNNIKILSPLAFLFKTSKSPCPIFQTIVFRLRLLTNKIIRS